MKSSDPCHSTTLGQNSCNKCLKCISLAKSYIKITASKSVVYLHTYENEIIKKSVRVLHNYLGPKGFLQFLSSLNPNIEVNSKEGYWNGSD